jgi:hypothetical protein
MAFPTIAVEAAWTSKPGDAVQNFVSLGSRLRRLRVQRGRARELDRFPPGTSRATLKNTDRALEPLYAGSPWYPNVRIGRQIRYTATYGGVTYPLATNFIESIDPRWPGGTTESAVEVAGQDALAVLAGKKLNVSAYPARVLADGATAYYRLGDRAPSTVAVDSSPNAYHGTYTGAPVLGMSGALLTDADSAVYFAATNGVPATAQSPAAAGVAGLGDFSVELWVNGVVNEAIIRQGSDWYIGGTDTGLDGSPGVYSLRFEATGRMARLSNDVTVIKPTGWHHIVGTRTAGALRLYYDGVEIDNDTGAPAGNLVGGPITISPGAAFIVDEVALYRGVALTAAQVAAHYVLGKAGFSQQLSGARVNAALDASGWPPGLRNVEAGRSTLPAPTSSLTSEKSLDYMQAVAESENAMLFADAQNRVTFFDRAHNLYAPANQSRVTLGDDMASGTQLRYPPGAVEPKFDLFEVNTEVQVNRAGGAVFVIGDPATEFLPRTLERRDLQLLTDAGVVDYGNYLLGRRKDAHWRVDTLTLDPRVDARLWPHVLGREIGDLVTLVKHPPGGGTALTLVMRIEGITHDVDAARRTWVTTWNLSPADTDAYIILDDPAYGLNAAALFY